MLRAQQSQPRAGRSLRPPRSLRGMAAAWPSSPSPPGIPLGVGPRAPEIDVGDAQGVEPPRQRRPIEIGRPRRGKRSNVGSRAEVRRREQSLEFGPVVDRVADGPNGGQLWSLSHARNIPHHTHVVDSNALSLQRKCRATEGGETVAREPGKAICDLSAVAGFGDGRLLKEGSRRATPGHARASHAGAGLSRRCRLRKSRPRPFVDYESFTKEAVRRCCGRRSPWRDGV